MTMNAKDVPFTKGKAVDPVDAGSYPARTVQIIDLGVQEQSYNGEPKPPKQQLMITYELLDEFMKDDEGNDLEDKPRWLSEEFPLNNLGSEKAKSTIRYYALDPEVEYGGDWEQLTNVPCVLTVIQNPGKGANKDRIYNKIAGVSTMRAKDAKTAPALVNPPLVLSLDSDNVEAFNDLPDWIKKKITESLEWETTNLYAALDNAKEPVKKTKVKKEVVINDAIPFDDDETDADANW